MCDAYRNLALERRISSIRDGDVTHHGAPIGSRRLTVQPRKKTDVVNYSQDGSDTGVDSDAPKVWAPRYLRTDNDIVIRLRELAADSEWLGLVRADDLREAADAIEQLHAERDAERDLADQLARALLDGPFRGDRRDRMYGSGWADVHDALDTWQRVRRDR